MTPQFDNVPVYTPPYPERPAERLPLLKALRLMAKDILRPFPVKVYADPVTKRRVLGRDLHIFNAPEYVREAFLAQHEPLQRKTPQMRSALEPLLGDGLFVSEGPVWKERRALVNPIVHAKHMASFYPIMLDAAVEWRDQWRAHVDQAPVDVLHEMGLLTAEIISRAVFGQRLGRQYTGEVVSNFAEFQRHLAHRNVAEMVRLPRWVPRFQRRQVAQAARRIQAVVDKIIDEHLKERAAERQRKAEGTEGVGPQHRAMIARLFDAGEDGSAKITREGIRNEAITLFMAGHETTANTMAWAFFLLSQADWARERLAAELREVLGGRLPRYEDLDRLVYTKAVIEETLRLYPPVPILGREAMCPARVKDVEVAQGSVAMVAPWLLHRNPTLWERPDDFVPERFLPEADRPNKYQYVPFAIGPRVCPGLAFGLTEAVVCLAVLAQSYALKLAPGVEVMPQTTLTLRPGDSLPMLITGAEDPATAAATAA